MNEFIWSRDMGKLLQFSGIGICRSKSQKQIEEQNREIMWFSQAQRFFFSVRNFYNSSVLRSAAKQAQKIHRLQQIYIHIYIFITCVQETPREVILSIKKSFIFTWSFAFSSSFFFLSYILFSVKYYFIYFTTKAHTTYKPPRRLSSSRDVCKMRA